ncbi:alkaline phosphatase family protein [Oceanibaculum pacificum]|uniref:Sulfatase N-terminal domain-containing protein n=1 Tax=Oceanibaculum pacificum TaxID=580166 RepID=A0A154VQH8_9PROT|nr:hypothetical protein [Oceanibaculum pacificum]KZD03500.1 hypothetical protein AUP43_12810 [Oceanibaculum pacificum]
MGSRAFATYLLVAAVLSALVALPFRLPPDHPLNLLSFSIEAVAALALLALVPALRERPAARHAAAALMALICFVALGDLMTRLALSRPLNLALDLRLLPSVADLALGGLGPALGMLALLVVGLLPVLAYGLTLAAGAAVQRLGRHTGGRIAAVTAVLLVGGLHLVQEQSPGLFHRFWPSSVDAGRTLTAQWQQYREVRASAPLFRAAGQQDALAVIPPDKLLAGLDGADVMVAFVESYGESTLSLPAFRPTMQRRLDSFARTVEQSGLHAMSGWIVSATSGGQSWLAHSTLLSGMLIDSQFRYDLLVGSERRTLAHYFAKAGYRTVDIQPAIVKPWPAGDFFGFDAIYQAGDLGYEGSPFGWVTMPDQFTLSRLQALERAAPAGEAPGRAPLFAHLALISSHAPFTPLAPILPDWSALGDGSAFDAVEQIGQPSEDVWRDIGLLRDHYIRAIDYSLTALEGYAARHVDDRTLLVVLGDHQPLPMLAGKDAGQAVPVHVLSGDPALLKPFAELGFVRGMAPRPDGSRLKMEAFRDFFVASFSDIDRPLLAERKPAPLADGLDAKTRSN